MKKVLLFTFAILIAFSQQAWSQELKLEEVTSIVEFQKKNTEQKLQHINQLITDKKAKSYTFSEYLHRLWWDAISAEKTIMAKIDKYASLKAQNSKLPTNYDFEKTLIMQYFSEDPVVSKASVLDQLKALKKLQDGKKISWPAAAPFYTGLLALHLAQNPEFQKMVVKDKVAYIKQLEGTNAVGSISSAPYLKGLVLEEISVKPVDQKKQTYDQYIGIVGFFAKGTMEKAYHDMKK